MADNFAISVGTTDRVLAAQIRQVFNNNIINDLGPSDVGAAALSQSPFIAEIGGTYVRPLQITQIRPSILIQDGNSIITTGNGVWIDGFADYYGTASVGATSFSFPNLEGCFGSLMTAMPSTITSLDAPNLAYVASGILPSSSTLASLTSINLPKLAVADFSWGVGNTLNSLTTLNLDSLVRSGALRFGTNNALTSYNFPRLKYVKNGSITLSSTSCTSISFPSLVSVGDNISITAPSCTTLTLPPLGTLKEISAPGAFLASSSAFDQATVDNILAALAYMDGTNFTTAYSGRTVTITGTSSAPTNLGSITTAGSNFVGSTTTCTVNLTSHGYATGDVLRVSGITTLTNANKYAVITVVNANQFTYTITSQTATGAGTATIVKADASAKALVTRGVTLTTN